MKQKLYINTRSGVKDFCEFESPHGYLMCCKDPHMNLWRVYKKLRIKKGGVNDYKFLGYARSNVTNCFKIYQSFVRNNLKNGGLNK